MLTRRRALNVFVSGAAVAAVAPLAGCTISVFSDTGDDSTSAAELRTYDAIMASGVLRVGIVTDLKPYSYADDTGVYQGFDVNLARRVAQDMGVAIEFVSVETPNRMMFLQNNRVDMILSCFSVTEDRKEKIDFSECYLRLPTGLLSHTSNPLTNIEEAGSRPIIVTAGSSTELKLATLYPDLNLEKYDSYASSRMAFENNEDSAWGADISDLIAFANQTPGKYVLGVREIGETWYVAPALSKGNTTFLEWLNAEMITLGSENFFHKNYEKTLLDTYGIEYEEIFVVEPGQD